MTIDARAETSKEIRGMLQKQSELMTRREAAAYLRLSPVTLAKWQTVGKGLAVVRLGSRVLYRRQDLDAFITSRRQEPVGVGAS